MAWLGLDWDGDVVYQFARAARHAEAANALLETGHAYRCYATAEELEAMRAAQRAARQPMRYDGRWRDRSSAEAPAGAPFVIRLKAPRDGSVTIDDLVQGPVTVANAELDDMVLLRSDGTPTICWRSSSTITTWASPTSSAATIISTTHSASSR